MKKRSVLLIGFSLGYFWRASKPARIRIEEITAKAFYESGKKAFYEQRNKERQDIKANAAKVRDTSTGLKSIKVTVDTRDAAEFLIHEMEFMLDKCGYVTRRNLALLCSLPEPPNAHLGWTNLDDVSIQADQGKYVVRFPAPKEIS